jgi:hypothetical protein
MASAALGQPQQKAQQPATGTGAEGPSFSEFLLNI